MHFQNLMYFPSTSPCYQIASNLVHPFKSSLEILLGANYLVTVAQFLSGRVFRYFSVTHQMNLTSSQASDLCQVLKVFDRLFTEGFLVGQSHQR